MRNFKKTLLGAVAVCALLCAPLSMTAQSLSPSTKWNWPEKQRAELRFSVQKQCICKQGLFGL